MDRLRVNRVNRVGRVGQSVGGWSPAALPGLVLWLEARATDGSSGSAVASAPDRSGNGHNFSVGGAPTVVNTGGSWVYRFDGVDDELIGGDLSALFPSAGTLAWRFSASEASGFVAVSTKSVDGWDNFEAANSYVGQFRSVRVDAQPVISGSGAKHTVLVRSSGSGYTRRLDGSQDVTAAAGHDGGNAWRVGRESGRADRWLAGDVAAVVAYSSALSDADAALLEAYLGALLP